MQNSMEKRLSKTSKVSRTLRELLELVEINKDKIERAWNEFFT